MNIVQKIFVVMLAVTFAMFSVTAEAKSKKSAPSPEWVANLSVAQDAEQIFVVAAVDKTTAWVSLHEKDSAGNWRQIMSTPGFIGQNGLGKTKDGDGKTPVGNFKFNAAFGLAKDPGCAIPYTQVDKNFYWSGDSRVGMNYNRLTDIRVFPDLKKEVSEHLTDYKAEYQYCLNINYNPAAKAELGNAIFVRCLGAEKPFTAGGIAIPKDKMARVMKTVKPNCVVVIDSLKKLGGKF